MDLPGLRICQENEGCQHQLLRSPGRSQLPLSHLAPAGSALLLCAFQVTHSPEIIERVDSRVVAICPLNLDRITPNGPYRSGDIRSSGLHAFQHVQFSFQIIRFSPMIGAQGARAQLSDNREGQIPNAFRPPIQQHRPLRLLKVDPNRHASTFHLVSGLLDLFQRPD